MIAINIKNASGLKSKSQIDKIFFIDDIFGVSMYILGYNKNFI